jgi:hypothetical protein
VAGESTFEPDYSVVPSPANIVALNSLRVPQTTSRQTNGVAMIFSIASSRLCGGPKKRHWLARTCLSNDKRANLILFSIQKRFSGFSAKDVAVR